VTVSDFRKFAMYDIIHATARCHAETLDPETCVGDWPELTAHAASHLDDSSAINYIREQFDRRQRELSAARWYEAN
jgi:hypothetical protein